MKGTTCLISLILLLWSCNNHPPKKESVEVPVADTTKEVSFPRIFGDRSKITGDFNGDGRKDTLYESYTSELTGKETFKIMDTANWENNQDLVSRNKPVSRLYTNIPGVDSFLVDKDDDQSGFAFLSNLGDLNDDGGDEIGYIVDLTVNSNLNTYYILSLTKEKKWRSLFQFQIFEELLYEPERLFSNRNFVIKDGSGKIKYKFYSDSATVEVGERYLKDR